MLETWLEAKGQIVIENGSFVKIYGNDALLQRTRNRVARWANEFEYDTTGVDWLDLAEADTIRIRAVLKAYIEDDSEFIAEATNINLVRNSENRVVKITFDATATGGQLLPVEVEV
jgi:hypothetical protein